MGTSLEEKGDQPFFVVVRSPLVLHVSFLDRYCRSARKNVEVGAAVTIVRTHRQSGGFCKMI